MNNNHSSTLNNRYDGQLIFNARKDGYSFDVFSDTWELDYKNDWYRDWETDRKSTRLNSSHRSLSRMPSSA